MRLRIKRFKVDYVSGSYEWLVINKPLGYTPLETLGLLRLQIPELNDTKLSYAGRLDPLAKGELLVLVGEENKKRRHYEGFQKEYHFTVLPFFSTDSYDILGVNDVQIGIQSLEKNHETTIKLNQFCKLNQGLITQQIPPFSSYRINGRPSFYWARNKIKVEPTPIREIMVHDFQFLRFEDISIEDLKKEIYKRVGKVNGDFRQEEILESWDKSIDRIKDIMEMSPTGLDIKIPLLAFKIIVDSGFYVRALCEPLQELLQTPMVIFEINRTCIIGI